MQAPPARSVQPMAYAIRLYFDLGDAPQIVDIPVGAVVTPAVERARAAGGTRLRVVALDGAGRTLDRVVIR